MSKRKEPLDTKVDDSARKTSFPRISNAPVNDSVGTPDELFDSLHKRFDFTHDPCPLNGATTADVPDGLATAWGLTTFVNPPYSNIAPWLAHAVSNMQRFGTRSVVLVPAHVETLYWDTYVTPWASEVWFCVTGLRFKNYTSKFPLPMALIFYGQFYDDLPLPRRTGMHEQAGDNHWSVSVLPRGLRHLRLRRLDRALGRLCAGGNLKRTKVNGKN